MFKNSDMKLGNVGSEIWMFEKEVGGAAASPYLPSEKYKFLSRSFIIKNYRQTSNHK